MSANLMGVLLGLAMAAIGGFFGYFVFLPRATPQQQKHIRFMLPIIILGFVIWGWIAGPILFGGQ